MSFSGLIKKGSDPKKSDLWVRAVHMGAFCADAIDPDTTHLVTKPPPTTERCRLAALVPGCRVVNISWLEECFRQKRRVDETEHLLRTVLESTEDSAPGVNQSSLDEMDEEVAALLAEDSSDDETDNLANIGTSSETSTVHAPMQTALDEDDRDLDEYGLGERRPSKRMREDDLGSDEDHNSLDIGDPEVSSSGSGEDDEDENDDFEQELMSRFNS